MLCNETQENGMEIGKQPTSFIHESELLRQQDDWKAEDLILCVVISERSHTRPDHPKPPSQRIGICT
jgi:hypothetical protein